MAGTIKVDTLQSDSNLALKIATANVAFIDATGINVVGGNLSVGGTQFASGGQIQTAGIADGAVTNDKIVSVANTKITGNIVSSQIAPEQTFYGNTIISGTGSFLRLASGTGGIQFGGDTSAANALDDYEEGDWTPVVAPTTGSLTAYTSSGFYTKIGRVVSLYCRFQITTAGTASGQATITGLPFSGSGSFQQGGVCRETDQTGVIYFPNLYGANMVLQNSTNGGVVWTNNYRYETNIVYQV